MSMCQLYLTAGCSKSLACMIALYESGLNFEITYVDRKLQFSKDFRVMSPTGVLPILKANDKTIFGCASILRYIGRTNQKLYGDTIL